MVNTIMVKQEATEKDVLNTELNTEKGGVINNQGKDQDDVEKLKQSLIKGITSLLNYQVFLSEQDFDKKNINTISSFYKFLLSKKEYKELFLNFVKQNNILIINKDIVSLFNYLFEFYNTNPTHMRHTIEPLLEEFSKVDWYGFEASLYKYQGGESASYTLFKQIMKNILNKYNKIHEQGEIVKTRTYETKDFKIEVSNFSSLFLHRFNKLSSVLRDREQLLAPLSIVRALKKQKKEEVSLIGLVTEIRETSKGYVIVLEDTTGMINIYASKTSQIIDKVEELVLDEVIGVRGQITFIGSRKFVFASDIFFPDVPNIEHQKFDDDTYVVFTSDLHVGSKLFLDKPFNKFIKWLNGELGNELQRNIAKKVKYLFLLGDLVDGVGTYKGQEEDLEILDIKEQYNYTAELLSQINTKIKMFLIPGNHDGVRIAEPQPTLDKEFASSLYKLSNTYLLTNPSWVYLEQQKNKVVKKVKILMYHGYSFNFYLDHPYLKKRNVIDNLHTLMAFLLRKRHLAPSHGSTQYIPDPTEDPLVIDDVPDIFASGHIHKVSVGRYKGITLLNCSAWQSRTPYQIKYNIVPQPSRAIIMNLKDYSTKIIRFE